MNSRFSKERTRSNLRIFGGTSNPNLTKSIAKKVGVQVGDIKLTKFANNETNVDLKENVRGQDIYIIQTGGGPNPNDDLMELLFMINAFKLSSADFVNVIIPYFFYSKGDQKDTFKRVPITAKLVTNMLKKAGASRVMIIEPHTPQLEGFFDTPVDALRVHQLFCNWIQKNIEYWRNCVIVSPDEGSTKRGNAIANDLNLDFALINNRKGKNNHDSRKAKKSSKRKRRIDSQSSSAIVTRSQSEIDSEFDTSEATTTTSNFDEKMKHNDIEMGRLTISLQKPIKQPYLRKVSVSGSVSGRHVIIVDDMIDTGHTLKNAVEVLKKFGATGAHVLATHGIFSGDCFEILDEQKEFIKQIVITNTIPQVRSKDELADKLTVIDVSGLIAEYIRRQHYHESVAVLQHFMPIRANDKEFEEDSESSETASEEENEDSLIGSLEINLDDEVVVEEIAGEPSEEDKARDLRLMHLRKGFRLSSMCWDD